MSLLDDILKARKKPRHPVDGDADGRVHDGTPRERPAIPNVDLDKPKGPKGIKGPKKLDKPKATKGPKGPKKPQGPKKPKAPETARRFSKPKGQGARELGGAWKIERDGKTGVGARVFVSDGRDEHVINVSASDYEDMRNEILAISQQGYEVRDVKAPKPPKERVSETLEPREPEAPKTPDPPKAPDRVKTPDGVDPATGEIKKPEAKPEPKKPDAPKPEAKEPDKKAGFFERAVNGEVGYAGKTSKDTSSGGSDIFTDESDDTGVKVFIPGKGLTSKRATFVKSGTHEDAYYEDENGKRQKLTIRDGKESAVSELLGSAMQQQMGYNIPGFDVTDWDSESPRLAQNDIGQHRGKQVSQLGTWSNFSGLVAKVQDAEETSEMTFGLAEWDEYISEDKRAKKMVKHLGASEDPGALFRMSLHDSLMLQGDRHDGNIMMSEDGSVVPFDNDWGFAEGAWATGKQMGFEEDVDVPMDWDSWMNFRNDAGGRLGNWAAMTTALGAAVLGNDTEKLRAELDRALEEAERVDVKEIRAKLESQGMPKELQAIVLDNLADFEERIRLMREDADHIVEALSK